MQEATRRSDMATTRPADVPIAGRDLLFVLVVTALLLILVRLSVGAPARTIEFVLAMLALQSAIPIAVIYLFLVRGRGLRWAEIGLRPAPARWYWWAVLLALASLPLVGLVNYATQVLMGGPLRNPQIDLLAPGGFSWRGLVGMLVMAGLVAPVVEEIVFRGLLYGWLRPRLGAAIGIAASALLFAVAHGVLHLVPALAVQGMLLAFLYERSGSLGPAMVMHGVFNAMMTTALYAALAAGVAL